MSAEHESPGEIAGIALLDARDAKRVAFEAHASSCETCGREWRRAARLSSLLGTLATPPPPSEKAMARTQARVRAMLAAEPKMQPVAPRSVGLLVAGAVLVSVAFAFAMLGPPISTKRVIVALATIGVAALLPGMALRSERDAIGGTIGALALSVGLACLDQSQWDMVAGHTIGCLQIELAIGALPLFAMVGFARGTGARLGSLASACAGACGALAGQGVLLTSCAADESVMHVLVFHVAGVLVATIAGALLGGAAARVSS